jgi:hypothetical protein
MRHGYGHIWYANRDCWLATLEAVQRLQPRRWLIENVKMAQWVWGRAPYHYGSFFLWGWFPHDELPRIPWTTSLKGTHFDRATKTYRYEDRSPSERAIIPRPLAEAVHRAVCDA